MKVYRIYNCSKPTGKCEMSFLDCEYAITVADFLYNHNHKEDEYKVIEYDDELDSYKVIKFFNN